MKALYNMNFDQIKPVKTGKVRNIYDLQDSFLFVATDRISAFDYILPNPVPDKGKVLTQLSKFWFNFLKDITKTHYITDDISNYNTLAPYANDLIGRSMIVKKAEVIPVECVVRGYISGSAWNEYKEKGTVNEEIMQKGLKESEKLKEPIFTPATKAETGHDENIPFNKMASIIGLEISEKLREKSLSIYIKARDYLEYKGIILADTKFEFGLIDNEIILIDEVLTPDSSRFWPVNEYKVGQGQNSFDKQFVRDYLNSIKWDKKPPVPELPENVIIKTREKYLEAFKLITGFDL